MAHLLMALITALAAVIIFVAGKSVFKKSQEQKSKMAKIVGMIIMSLGGVMGVLTLAEIIVPILGR